MHTYTPTASHDPVVEFDNGDLGNQTNLNNAVRALGNRTQLAKETNDTQGTAIGVLQASTNRWNQPSVLDITPTLTATGDGGAYAGGENVFAFTKVHLSGFDMGTPGSTDLDTATYTGTGGGTKIIRLAPTSRYRLDLSIVLWANGGVTSPAPNLLGEYGMIRVDTGTNTAVSAGVVTERDITGTPSQVDNNPAPDDQVLMFTQSVLLRNTTGSPKYARIRLIDPVNNGTYAVKQGNILVQYIGNT